MEVEDLSHVTCSAAHGHIVALTWDGRPFIRDGNNPVDSNWTPLITPRGQPLIEVCIGERVAWAISCDGQVGCCIFHNCKKKN